MKLEYILLAIAVLSIGLAAFVYWWDNRQEQPEPPRPEPPKQGEAIPVVT